MKKILIIISLLCSVIAQPLSALVVKDPFLIAVSLDNARRDLTNQILQEGNQRTQLLRMLDQIKQIDDFLDRLGDPEQITDLEGLDEMIEFLRKLEMNKPSEEIIRDVKGDEVHISKVGSMLEAVQREIVVDGEVVGQMDSTQFESEMAAGRTLEHYREVRSSVLEQRSEIKKELDAILHQLRAAKTQSEVQKLAVVSKSLEAQLAATDREMQFATNEVMTRFMERELNRDVQAKAHIQTERAALKSGTEKDLKLYQLIQKPVPFKR